MQTEPEPEPAMSKRKMDSKLKIIKDLSFLLDHRPLPLDSHTTKYVLQAGEGDSIRQMNHDFNIVYSFKSYSFEGRNLNGFPEGKMAKFDKKDPIMLKLLTSMKVEEKAWFNVCEEPVFKVRKTKEQEEDIIDELEGIEEVQLTAEYEELPSDDSSERKGVNYEIAVLRLEYKNMDTIEGKRVVVEQKKVEARAHMHNKEYLEAIRIYRYLYDINSNCSKKHFSENEGIELEALSNNARANFLKVFFKLVETDPSASKEFAELAENSIKHLLAKQSNDNVIHFLNAKWELRQRNLQLALDAAKRSYSIKATVEAAKLFQLVKEQIRNKHKIRVKVEQGE